jgi:drug/metabolite transporter (DMT)-like permease
MMLLVSSSSMVQQHQPRFVAVSVDAAPGTGAPATNTAAFCFSQDNQKRQCSSGHIRMKNPESRLRLVCRDGIFPTTTASIARLTATPAAAAVMNMRGQRQQLPIRGHLALTSISEKSPSNDNQIMSSPARGNSNNDNSGNNKQINDGDDGEFRRGVGVLLTVPIAWGSYEPAVRLLYKIQPDIPPFLFSFVYYLIATVALTTVSSFVSPRTEPQPQTQATACDAGVNNTSLLHEKQQKEQQQLDTTSGGFELGTYLFVGNALQVLGLQEVASDRAAFELQLTTILVPIIQSILSRNLRLVNLRTWMACLVALAGVGLIGLDGNSDEITTKTTAENGITNDLTSSDTTFDLTSMLKQVSFSTGDILIMLGALFYTFHCIRLEVYAQKTQPIQLASSKAKTETGWSALVLVTCVMTAILVGSDDVKSLSPLVSLIDAARSSGDNVLAYMQGLQMEQGNVDDCIKVGAATAWTGLITVAYTIAAQVRYCFSRSLRPWSI